MRPRWRWRAHDQHGGLLLSSAGDALRPRSLQRRGRLCWIPPSSLPAPDKNYYVKVGGLLVMSDICSAVATWALERVWPVESS